MFCMVIMPTKPALVFHSNNNLPFCCWHLWVLPPATCCKQIWCRAFLRDKLGRKLAYMTNELRQESFCFFSDRDTVTDIWKGWFPLAHLLLLVVWHHLTECKSVAQRCIFFPFLHLFVAFEKTIQKIRHTRSSSVQKELTRSEVSVLGSCLNQRMSKFLLGLNQSCSVS